MTIWQALTCIILFNLHKKTRYYYYYYYYSQPTVKESDTES